MFHMVVQQMTERRYLWTITALVLGVMLSVDALAQNTVQELVPIVNTDRYPLGPQVDGFELRSFRNSFSQARRHRSRFTVVLGGKAVLDKKTGLVWERSPDGERRDWSSAMSYCASKVVGGRKGWRIPVFAELSSILEPSNQGGQAPFTVGSPFKNVKSYRSSRNVELAFYWLAKANADGPDGAWDVFQNVGINGSIISEENKFLVWCLIGEGATEDSSRQGSE